MPKHFEGERKYKKWRRGFFKPPKKGLDPSATGFILQTLPYNLGSGNFLSWGCHPLAEVAPTRDVEIFLIFAIELAKEQVGK